MGNGGIRPAVTGIGTALPLGVCDLEAFWQAICSGRSAVSGDAGGRAARMPAWDVSDYTDSKQARRMSPLSKLAFASLGKALGDAGLQSPPAKSALFFVSKFGSTEFLREFHEGLLGGGGPSPFLFTNGVVNAPAGHISLEFGIRGPCTTLMGGAQSAAFALQHAAALIRDGAAGAVMVGAAEELSDFFLDAYRGFGSALGSAMPAPGEGGVFLVLEPEGDAAARGARTHAVLAGADFLREGDPSPADERRMGGPRLFSLSSGPGRGLEAEAADLGAAPACEGDSAIAVKFNLGEAFAVSALAQSAAACLALSKGTAPARPEGLDPPGSLSKLFPGGPRETRFHDAVVSVRDGGPVRSLVRFERGRDRGRYCMPAAPI